MGDRKQAGPSSTGKAERIMMNTAGFRKGFLQSLPAVLVAYIVFQPLLDILTYIVVRLEFPVTPGTIVRPVFMLAAFFYVTFSESYPHRRAIRAYLWLVTGYLAFYWGWSLYSHGFVVSVQNMAASLQLFYFLYAFLFLYVFELQTPGVLSEWVLAGNAAGYTMVILIAYLTGTSYITYNAGYGYCGWFYSANDVSAALLQTTPILLCVAVERLCRGKQKLTALLGTVLVMFSVVFSAAFMGTKIIYLGVLAYLAVSLLWFLVRLAVSRSREFLRGTLVVAALLGCLLVLYPISPLNDYIQDIYMPMSGEDRESYEQSLQIPGIIEVDREKKNKSYEENAEGTWLGELIQEEPAVQKLNWLLSRRLLKIAPSLQQYMEGGAAVQLFGLGYVQTDDCDYVIDDLIEMDGMAVLLRHGVLGFLIYYLPFLGVILYVLVEFFRHFRQRISDYRYCSLLFGAMAAAGSSLLIGHVLGSPCVSLLTAVILVLLMQYPKNSERPEMGPALFRRVFRGKGKGHE